MEEIHFNIIIRCRLITLSELLVELLFFLVLFKSRLLLTLVSEIGDHSTLN